MSFTFFMLVMLGFNPFTYTMNSNGNIVPIAQKSAPAPSNLGTSHAKTWGFSQQ